MSNVDRAKALGYTDAEIDKSRKDAYDMLRLSKDPVRIKNAIKLGYTQEDIAQQVADSRELLALLGEDGDSVRVAEGVPPLSDTIGAASDQIERRFGYMEPPTDQGEPIESRYAHIKDFAGAFTQGVSNSVGGLTYAAVTGAEVRQPVFDDDSFTNQLSFAVGNLAGDVVGYGAAAASVVAAVPTATVATVAGAAAGLVAYYKSVVGESLRPGSDKGYADTQLQGIREAGIAAISTGVGAASGLRVAGSEVMKRVAPKFVASASGVATDAVVGTFTDAALRGEAVDETSLAVGLATPVIAGISTKAINLAKKSKEVVRVREVYRRVEGVLGAEAEGALSTLTKVSPREVSDLANAVENLVVRANQGTAKNILDIAESQNVDPELLVKALNNSEALQVADSYTDPKLLFDEFKKEGVLPKDSTPDGLGNSFLDESASMAEDSRPREGGVTLREIESDKVNRSLSIDSILADVADQLVGVEGGIKVDDIKVDGVKVDDIKVDDIKADDIKADDIKADGVKTDVGAPLFSYTDGAANTFKKAWDIARLGKTHTKAAATEVFDRFMFNYVNRANYAEKLDKAVKGAVAKNPDRIEYIPEIAGMVRSIYGADGMLKSAFTTGLRDVDGGVPDVPSLDAVFRGADGEYLDASSDRVFAVAMARRMDTLLNTGRLPNLPSGWTRDTVSDILSGASADEKLAASNMSKLYTGITKALVDGDILTPTQAQGMNLFDSDYIPMMRAGVEHSGGGKNKRGSNKPGALKELKGESTRPVLHPLETYPKFLEQAVRLKLGNDLRLAFVKARSAISQPLQEVKGEIKRVDRKSMAKALAKYGYSAKESDGSDPPIMEFFSPLLGDVKPGEFVVLEGGKAKRYKYDEDPFVAEQIEAMLDMAPPGWQGPYFNILSSVGRFAKNMFSVGIVYPAFVAQHFVRQEVLGPMFDKTAKPLVSTLKGIASVVRKDKDMQTFMQAGMTSESLFGSVYTQGSPNAKSYAKLLKDIPALKKSDDLAIKAILAKSNPDMTDIKTYLSAPMRAIVAPSDAISKIVHATDTARSLQVYRDKGAEAYKKAVALQETELRRYSAAMAAHNANAASVISSRIMAKVRPKVREWIRNNYDVDGSLSRELSKAKSRVKSERTRASGIDVSTIEGSVARARVRDAEQAVSDIKGIMAEAKVQAKRIQEEFLRSDEGQELIGKLQSDIGPAPKPSKWARNPTFMADNLRIQSVRDLVSDSGKAGKMIKNLGAYVPLLRVVIGHSEQIMRSFNKRNAGNMIALGLGTVIIPALIAQLTSMETDEFGNLIPEIDPDTGKKRYKRKNAWHGQSAYERQNYYSFYVGDGPPINVAKPFSIGAGYAGAVDRYIEVMNGDTDAVDAVATWASDLTSSVFHMNMMPQWMSSTYNVARNKDSFGDSPIISKKNQMVLEAYQRNNTTTDTAKVIGDAIGVSPVVVDYMTKQNLGSAGRIFLESSDKLMQTFGFDSLRPAPDLIDTAIVGSLYSSERQVFNGIVGKIYEEMEEPLKLESTYKALIKRGNTQSIRLASELLKNNPNLIAARGLRGVRSQIAAINNIVSFIYNTDTVAEIPGMPVGEDVSLAEWKSAALGSMVYGNPGMIDAVVQLLKSVKSMKALVASDDVSQAIIKMVTDAERESAQAGIIDDINNDLGL